MQKVVKSEIVKVIQELKSKGYSNEELAIKLNKSCQSIWAYSSIATDRVPCLSDYRVLKALTVVDKENVDKTK